MATLITKVMGKAPSPERVGSVFRAAGVADEALVLTLSQLDAWMKG